MAEQYNANGVPRNTVADTLISGPIVQTGDCVRENRVSGT